MKKLIPALALLLVSAVMLGTSSFAWFSMNSTVTASGMQVTAVTNANLYIKEGLVNDIASITGISANLTAAGTLKPAELTDAEGTVSVKVPESYTTTPTVDNAGRGNTWTSKGTFTKTTTTSALNATADDGIGNYIAGETLTIVRKSQNDSGRYDVNAVVTITLGAESNLNKALYCGFLVGNTFTQKAADNPSASTSATFTFNNLLSNVADNTAQQITFVVWYEGEDANCTSNNAIDVSTNTVAIEFRSADHQ